MICTNNASSSEEISLGSQFRVEIVQEIPINQIWQMKFVGRITSRYGTIGYWRFDPESAPVAGDWTGSGLILAGFGDVAETPIGVRLWSKIPSVLLLEESVKLSNRKDDAIAKFKLDPSVCGEDEDCKKAQVLFVIKPNGEFYAGDTLIGTVKQ